MILLESVGATASPTLTVDGRQSVYSLITLRQLQGKKWFLFDSGKTNNLQPEEEEWRTAIGFYVKSWQRLRAFKSAANMNIRLIRGYKYSY